MNDTIYINEGIIYSISTEDSNRYAEVIGNLRVNKNSQLGIACYQLRVNENSINNVLEYINSNSTLLPKTIALDIDTINNEEVMSALNRKANTMTEKPSIRITNPGYILTTEDYNKLNHFDDIIVDNAVDDLRDNNRVILQHEVFKYDEQAAVQPVIERRNTFDELIDRNCFHINHKLTDQEFELLSNIISNENTPSIELNIFDPNYYDEFFRKLQEYNIPRNINVCLIGYPLRDDSNIYNELEKYPYEIDILYSTCHDMVDLYTEEPYIENKLLHSQIEGGGKTSLSNYTNILKTLEDFQKQVHDLDLSPLETAIYAKNYIDNQYIYDPDYEDSDTDDWDNTNLSQILNHNDGTNKRGICLGFSTLYSALLRRCGIPMFRYGTTGHSRNIGRIKDDKYGVDTASVFDITWDLDDATYNYFGIAPRDTLRMQDIEGNYENMTIASNLSLPIEEYYGNLAETVDVYESFYHPSYYDPIGYTARMLELMGYIDENQEEIRFYEELYRITKNGNLEGISEDKIISAIDSVSRKQGMSSEEIENTIEKARTNFEEREFIFEGYPAVGGYDYTNNSINGIPHPVTPLTQDNIDDIIRNHNREMDMIFRNERPNQNENTDSTQTIIDNQQEEFDNLQEEINNLEEEINNLEEENIDQQPNINDEPVESITEYIPGTRIRRPRYRGVYETDEEYTMYLEDYYNRVFPQTENTQETNSTETDETIDNNLNDMLDEYIPGTNIPKPRNRGLYETDEEYEKFLEDYYSQFFTEEQMNRGRR